MNDSNRMWNFTRFLAEWQNKCPYLRFGQLLVNFMHWYEMTYNTDPFYTEDDTMIDCIERFFEESF